MSEAYLSLGSNMGDRIDNLSRAVALLDRPSEGVEVEQVSPVFETAPVGYKDQDDFLNICVKVKTDLEPLALLSLCQKIEETLHRVRKRRVRGESVDRVRRYHRDPAREKRLRALLEARLVGDPDAGDLAGLHAEPLHLGRDGRASAVHHDDGDLLLHELCDLMCQTPQSLGSVECVASELEEIYVAHPTTQVAYSALMRT